MKLRLVSVLVVASLVLTGCKARPLTERDLSLGSVSLNDSDADVLRALGEPVGVTDGVVEGKRYQFKIGTDAYLLIGTDSQGVHMIELSLITGGHTIPSGTAVAEGSAVALSLDRLRTPRSIGLHDPEQVIAKKCGGPTRHDTEQYNLYWYYLGECESTSSFFVDGGEVVSIVILRPSVNDPDVP